MAEVTVQVLTREASEKLSLKFSDLITETSAQSEEAAPEVRRLSLQSFFASNYANSPRRRLSLNEPSDKDRSYSASASVSESRCRPREFCPSSKLTDDSIIISLTSIAQNSIGPVISLGNCIPRPGDMKKGHGRGLQRVRSHHSDMSWKYKLLYRCGFANVDMVDNYVSIPMPIGHSKN